MVIIYWSLPEALIKTINIIYYALKVCQANHSVYAVHLKAVLNR